MRIKLIIPTIVFLLCYLIAYCTENYQAISNLNIRKGIGTKAEVIGSIAQGDKVLVDTIISGWGRIKVDGEIKGFASMKYLTKDFKDYSKKSNSSRNKKKDSPWQSLLMVLIIIILLVIFNGGKSKSIAD